MTIPDAATLILWCYTLTILSIAGLAGAVALNLLRWSRAARQEEAKQEKPGS